MSKAPAVVERKPIIVWSCVWQAGLSAIMR